MYWQLIDLLESSDSRESMRAQRIVHKVYRRQSAAVRTCIEQHVYDILVRAADGHLHINLYLLLQLVHT
jgi:hypothetical protein